MDDDECSVVFSLIQKNSRAEDSKLAIGLILYDASIPFQKFNHAAEKTPETAFSLSSLF